MEWNGRKKDTIMGGVFVRVTNDRKRLKKKEMQRASEGAVFLRLLVRSVRSIDALREGSSHSDNQRTDDPLPFFRDAVSAYGLLCMVCLSVCPATD